MDMENYRGVVFSFVHFFLWFALFNQEEVLPSSPYLLFNFYFNLHLYLVK